MSSPNNPSSDPSPTLCIKLGVRSEQAVPVFYKFRSSKSFIIACVSVAIFTDTFLYGVVVPIFPFALTERAGIHPDKVLYWTSILLAVYGGFLFVGAPLCGYMADRASSRRRIFLIGLLLLAGGTVILCVGKHIGLLLAARALQGLSSGFVWACGLALLVDTVGSDGIGQAMGYTGIGTNMGVLTSPLLGGVVFNKGGYYAVFGMIFGLIALDIALRIAIIDPRSAIRWAKNDGTQAVNDNKNLCEVQDYNVTRPEPDSLLLVKRKYPPVLTLLASRRFVIAIMASFVQATLTASFDAVLPVYVHKIFGWDSIGSGLIFLPVALPSLLGPIAGWIADRYGSRWLATTAFLFACPWYVCLRFVTHDDLSQKVLLCVLLWGAGLCLNMALAPVLVEIAYVIDSKEKETPGIFGSSGAYAQAYGLSCLSFAGGGVVGSIWAGMVNDKAGWGTMTWTLGLLSAVTAVPIALFLGGKISYQYTITNPHNPA